MSNPYSKLGYVGIAEETTPGTAIKPDTYIEILSEDINVEYAVTPATPVSSRRDVNKSPAKDKIAISGTITVLVEANNIGEFLNCFAGAPSNTTVLANKVYEHVWDLANTNEKAYTIDVQPADANYVIRYVGVKISQLAFSQSDNKIQCAIAITAQKAFTNARITTALGNSTALKLDQSSGVTTDDVLRVIDKDSFAVDDTASITTVDSETAITLAEVATGSVGDILVLQQSSPIFTGSDEMIWIGGSEVKMKADNNKGNPIYNTDDKNVEDFSINLNNELEARYAAKGNNLADRFPSSVKVKGFTADGNVNILFTNSERLDDMRSNEQVAIRFDFIGKKLDTNSAETASVAIGSGNAQILVTASTAGEDGNDLNVRIVANDTDVLAASIDGNNILLELASTTTASNTSTLSAIAINALTGVTAAAGGTGAGETQLVAKTNLETGRDANQRELLRIDLPHTIFAPFNQNIAEDDLIVEEIDWNAYWDATDSRTCRVLLRNAISDY